MTASRLIIYISVCILHEMCHLGKRGVVELAMMILGRMT